MLSLFTESTDRSKGRKWILYQPPSIIELAPVHFHAAKGFLFHWYIYPVSDNSQLGKFYSSLTGSI